MSHKCDFSCNHDSLTSPTMNAASPRPIPDAECAQSKCARPTVGCWDVCSLKRNPVVFAMNAASQPARVTEALDAISTWGPYGNDINESMRYAITLGDEVRRLGVALAVSEQYRREDAVSKIFAAPVGQGSATSGAFSCAKRAADPVNEFAACRQFCGNTDTFRNPLTNAEKNVIRYAAERLDNVDHDASCDLLDILDHIEQSSTAERYRESSYLEAEIADLHAALAAERAAAPTSTVAGRDEKLRNLVCDEIESAILAAKAEQSNCDTKTSSFCDSLEDGYYLLHVEMGSYLAERTAAPASVPEDRFYMYHGLWHDRVTGQHMYTQDQYDEESRACLAEGKLNAQISAAAPEVAQPAAQGEGIDTPEFWKKVEMACGYGEPGVRRNPLVAHVHEWGASQRQEGRRDMHETNVALVNENCALGVRLRSMRASFHVNMLRAFPDKTHAEIDKVLGDAAQGESVSLNDLLADMLTVDAMRKYNNGERVALTPDDIREIFDAGRQCRATQAGST